MIDTKTVIVERRKLGIDDAAMGLVTLNRPAGMNPLVGYSSQARQRARRTCERRLGTIRCRDRCRIGIQRARRYEKVSEAATRPDRLRTVPGRDSRHIRKDRGLSKNLHS